MPFDSIRVDAGAKRALARAPCDRSRRWRADARRSRVILWLVYPIGGTLAQCDPFGIPSRLAGPGADVVRGAIKACRLEAKLTPCER